MRGGWRWCSRARGTSDIDAVLLVIVLVLVLELLIFDCEDEEEDEGKNSAEQPINQRDLGEANGGDERPDKQFAQAQAALTNGGEPELELHRADGDDVAVAEPGGLDGLVVDGSQGVGRGHEFEAFASLTFQREVPVPNTGVVQLQIISGGATDVKRETADNRLAARLFP